MEPKTERTRRPDAGSETRDPQLRLLEVSSWTGGGLQLTVAIDTADLPDSGLKIVREDGRSIPFAIAPLADTAGMTAFVLVPSADEAIHTARVNAARAMIEALPAGERIGLWLGSGSLPLLSELTERRDHVLDRLAAVLPAEASPISDDVMSHLADRLTKVSAPFGVTARALVLVGSAPPASTDVPVLTPGRTAFAVAVLRETEHESNGEAWLTRHWKRNQSPADAGVALAHDLEVLRGAIVRIGSCDEFVPFERLTLELAGVRVMFEAPPRLSELADVPCDPSAAARDDYPLGDRVTFELTPEQLARHDQYDREQDETEFTLNIGLGDAAPVPARAHFRGQTSLNCSRKSYSVHFSDDSPRRLGSSAYGSEFYLISLCKDHGRFRQVLANRIMSKLGLFPLEQRYVQLRVSNRERGVYLLLEKPDEHFKRNQFALDALIRRRFEATGEPDEVKYPKPDRDPDAAAAALASYLANVDVTTDEPETLFAALSQRIDLDNYLRWLALQSVFQCGDYVDETFFYASQEQGADYFRNVGWDTDDLFTDCHHNAKYAFRDPHGLTFCAEAPLDGALALSAEVYQRYAETLAQLMRDDLQPDRVADELGKVRSDLLGRLTDDSICIGTGESVDTQPATCDRFRPVIEAEMNEFEANMRARADLLRQRLSEYGVEP
jgi:CotH kinase protein